MAALTRLAAAGMKPMGIEKMHSAKYWRDRAEEFRAKADNSRDHHVRKSLLAVARNYEELALRAEPISVRKDAAE